MRNTKVQDEFGSQFFCRTGTIEGGDGTPVQLIMMASSWNCVPERNAEYGCVRGERALCVAWIPAGMQYSKSGPDEDGFPAETGVDPSQLPPREEWVVFPRSFGGLPVYYKRGEMAWPL